MTPDYDAALFDMDGLLLDTELIVNQSLRATADHFNLQGLEQTFLDMIGFRGADSQSILERGLDGRVSYCLLYTSPSPRDGLLSRMPSSA